MVFETTLLLSAIAGLGSFLSPCILPIIPGFLSYLSSSSIKEANDESAIGENTTHNQKGSTIIINKKVRINIFINTVYFVLGFSLIFSVLGVILNSILATSIGNNFQHYLSYIGGIVIAAFGANLILSLKIRSTKY